MLKTTSLFKRLVLYPNTYLSHLDSVCLYKGSFIFKTGSTLKCHDALGLDFTALTYSCFSVALYILRVIGTFFYFIISSLTFLDINKK